MILNNKYTFSYTGSEQTWTVPYTGDYKLEVWGAQGGSKNNNGAKGGYSEGCIHLKKGQKIYIYVGACPNYNTIWNGGGHSVYSGGDASDIRIDRNTLTDRVIVAGGGGGTGIGPNGTWNYIGGAGGSLIGGNGTGPSYYIGYGGTQTSGGLRGASVQNNWYNESGSFGQGGNCYANANGGAGGGGWYGGGSGECGEYEDAGGGGGSSYIGGVMNGRTTAGINTGNGKVTITYYEEYFFIENNGKYYITNKENFDINSNFFYPVSIFTIRDYIKNGIFFPLSELNNPFTIDGIKYTPSDILDFTKCKICIFNENNLYKININYDLSNLALSKTNIKIKDKYTPISNQIEHTSLDITPTNKLKIDYFLDYGQGKSYENCSILNTKTINNDFYANFKLNSVDSLLSSITLYGKNNDKYKKLKNTSIDVYDNLKDKKFITFSSDYDEVIVNKLTKQSLDYTINTLDRF